ncbi:MAG TPA: histidine kinase [Mucilaginibacter sp.]|jgi:two-component system LytT family sensor kinase|nr:histidine kinase [Mucilaginibacter sp.]
MRFIKKHWLEILLHVLAWGAVLYVLSAIGASNTFEVRVKTIHNPVNNAVLFQRHTVRSLQPFSFFIVGFLMLLFYSNIFWLFEKLLKWKNGYNRIAAAALWFGILFFADYIIVGFFQDFKPPKSAIFPEIALQNIVSDKWRHIQLEILLIFLFIQGASIAYFFSKAWVNNELIRKQLAAHQLSTEIKFLKSQINPHFLFNTLNNLFSMAQGNGNEELADGISKLSEMMRYMIYESNAEIVPLSKEIEYLKNSIVLNKLRYADDEVKVVFNYPEHLQDLYIAPMIFIPFVENAFKHGVLINRSSQIDISISVVGEKSILFTCENTDYGFIRKMDDVDGGIGLENVKRRLELVYPGKYDLAIKKEEDKYVVALKIDLE